MLDVARKEEIPFQALLASLGRSRATAYRSLKPNVLAEKVSKKCSRAAHARALSPFEIEEVVKVLNSEKFVDKAPQAIFNVLLDQGVFLCSVRTMYRILEAQGAVAERRQVAPSRSFTAPELLATGSNQVWSWDISKLRAA